MSSILKRVDSGADNRPSPASAPSGVTRVLVVYEQSANGRAALFHALSLAREAQAAITVASVATHERVDVGCARCRQSAAMWNMEMRSLAEEALADAASLAGPASTVDYVVARGGRSKDAIAQAAERSGAEVIVLPWERIRRLRSRFSQSIAEQLRRGGRWEVVIAPPAAPPDAAALPGLDARAWPRREVAEWPLWRRR